MAQGSKYQGAWQEQKYQGAWQQQTVTIEVGLSDSITPGDALVAEVDAPTIAESSTPTDSLDAEVSPTLTDSETPSDTLQVEANVPLADTETPTDLLGLGGVPVALDDSASALDLDFPVYARLEGNSQHFYRNDLDFPESSVTGNFTFQWWMKPDFSVDPMGTIVSKWRAATNDNSFIVIYLNREIRVQTSSDGSNAVNDTTSGLGILDNQWTHVAVAYDASAGTADVYKNGVWHEQLTGLHNSIYDGAAPFMVGWEVWSDDFDCDLANLSFFDDIRTPAEIAIASRSGNKLMSFVGDPNLITQWLFNDSAGANFIDNLQGDAGRDLIPNEGGDVVFSGLRGTGEDVGMDVEASGALQDSTTPTDVLDAAAAVLLADTTVPDDSLVVSVDIPFADSVMPTDALDTPPGSIDAGSGVGDPEGNESGSTIFGISKQPKTWEHLVSTGARQIAAVNTTSENTTYTANTVQDVIAWDLSDVDTGFFVVTEDGYIGLIETVGTPLNGLTVREWWKDGISREGRAVDMPVDGQKATIHRRIRARSVLITARYDNDEYLYVGTSSDLTQATGHPVSYIETNTNSGMVIEARNTQWLNLTKLWIIAGGTRPQYYIATIDARLGEAGGFDTGIRRVSLSDSISEIDMTDALSMDSMSETLEDATTPTDELEITDQDETSFADSVTPTEALQVEVDVGAFADSTTPTDSLSIVEAGGGVWPSGSPMYNDVLVSGPYAYVLTQGGVISIGIGNGIFIFDCSDPADPKRVSYFELDPPSSALDRMGMRLQKVDDVLYVISKRGLFAIDVSDPFNPVELDYLDPSPDALGGDSAPHLVIYGSIAYLSFNFGNIRLADISDPTSLATIPMGLTNPKNWEDERWYRYLGNWGALVDPPDHDGTWGPDPFYHINAGNGERWLLAQSSRDIRVTADHIYIADGHILWRFDRTAPYALDTIYTCAFCPNGDGNVMGFDLVGTTIYASVTTTTANHSFVEINGETNAITDNAALTMGGGLYFYNEVQIVGDYAYVNGVRGASIVDLNTFAEVGYIDAYSSFGFRGIYVYGDHIYVCWWIGNNYNDGHQVRIYNILDKTAPVLVGACAWDVDVTVDVSPGGDVATSVGNPSRSGNFPNVDIDDTFAASAWDMRYFHDGIKGWIYVGAGDYVRNRGETDMVRFDSSDSFAIETAIQEHQVSKMMLIGSDLHVPGIDAVAGSDGYFYTKTGAGAWVQSAAIPGAAHVYDITKLGSDYYALLGLTSPTRTEIYKWDGVSWVLLLANSPRIHALSTEVIMILKDRHWHYDGAVLTEHVMDMFPSYPYASTTVNRTEEYSGTVLYVDNFAKLQRIIATPLYRFDPNTDTITTHLDGYVVRDVIVRGSVCYALSVDVAASGDYTGRIHRTNNFTNWTQVSEFTTDAPPQSFELMDDNDTFYVGLGGGSYGNVNANSGAIMKVT